MQIKRQDKIGHYIVHETHMCKMDRKVTTQNVKNVTGKTSKQTTRIREQFCQKLDNVKRQH